MGSDQDLFSHGNMDVTRLLKENHLQNMDLNKLNTMTLPNIIIYVFFQIDTSIDTI